MNETKNKYYILTVKNELIEQHAAIEANSLNELKEKVEDTIMQRKPMCLYEGPDKLTIISPDLLNKSVITIKPSPTGK